MAFSVQSFPSILLVFVLLLIAFATGARGAQSVTLAWDSNPEPDIAGYRLYYGKTSHSYRQYIGNVAKKGEYLPGHAVGDFTRKSALHSSGIEGGGREEVGRPLYKIRDRSLRGAGITGRERFQWRRAF